MIIRLRDIGAVGIPGADRVPVSFVRRFDDERTVTISVESGINRESFTIDSVSADYQDRCVTLLKQAGFRVFREGWFDQFGGPE